MRRGSPGQVADALRVPGRGVELLASLEMIAGEKMIAWSIWSPRSAALPLRWLGVDRGAWTPISARRSMAERLWSGTVSTQRAVDLLGRAGDVQLGEVGLWTPSQGGHRPAQSDVTRRHTSPG